MPPLSRTPVVVALALALVSFPTVGCRKKASATDCAALVRHFAEVSARERGVDGGAEIAAIVESAKTDPEALACTDEIEERQVQCALVATTSEAVLTCLEK